MKRLATMAVTALILGVTAPITVPFLGEVAGAQVRVGDSSAEDCSNDVDVQVDQDACSQVLSVSVGGDASGTGTCGGSDFSEVGGVDAGCISISGTGDASNTGDHKGCGHAAIASAAAGCIAVSGTGNASNSGDRFSCGGAGAGVAAGCIAVSGGGNASNSGAEDHSCGSGEVVGLGVGCIAVSGTGNASNGATYVSCGHANTLALGVGCVAVSGTGTASNAPTNNSCGSGWAGIGVGCIAVSGDGDASNSPTTFSGDPADGSCGTAQPAHETLIGAGEPPLTIPGVGVGCIAVSGTGSASNTPGANSCGVTEGEAAAVGCVEVGGGDL